MSKVVKKNTFSEKQKKDYKKVVYALVSAQLLLEAMDEIKETSIFKMQIKKNCKALERDLEKILGKDFIEVYKAEDWAFRALTESFHVIAKWTSTAPYPHIIELGRALNNDEIKFIDATGLSPEEVEKIKKETI